jgi:hypothetical protein
MRSVGRAATGAFHSIPSGFVCGRTPGTTLPNPSTLTEMPAAAAASDFWHSALDDVTVPSDDAARGMVEGSGSLMPAAEDADASGG